MKQADSEETKSSEGTQYIPFELSQDQITKLGDRVVDMIVSHFETLDSINGDTQLLNFQYFHWLSIGGGDASSHRPRADHWRFLVPGELFIRRYKLFRPDAQLTKKRTPIGVRNRSAIDGFHPTSCFDKVHVNFVDLLDHD